MFLSVHILRTCVEFRGCSFKQTKLIASPRKCRQYFAKPVARKVKKKKKIVSVWRSLRQKQIF